MKKTVRIAACVLLAVALLCAVVGCGETPAAGKDDLWSGATYRENTTLGTGKTTVQVECKVGEHTVLFTLKTDKTTLGDALLEHELIAGDPGEYGMYVKKVNGITADYDVDRSYWAFYKGGEYLMTGVDVTDIADGEHYEIVYTKEE